MPGRESWRWRELVLVASWPEFHPNALLRLLLDAEVNLVVVGGYAAIAHGATRITHDLDICFAGEQPNLERLGEVLIGLHARLREAPEDLPFVPDARTLARMQILTLDTDEGPLDLLVQPSGSPRYAELRGRAEVLEIGSLPVHVASLEDLIAMKRAAARGKDLLDLAELEAIARLRPGKS